MTHTSFDHGAMIRNPNRWPSWPVLPLKRKDNSLESKNLGVLLGDPPKSGKITVIHIYMFDLPMSSEELGKAPRTEYGSVDELLQDGWVVD